VIVHAGFPTLPANASVEIVIRHSSFVIRQGTGNREQGTEFMFRYLLLYGCFLSGGIVIVHDGGGDTGDRVSV